MKDLQVKTVYKCPICRKEYDTYEDAEKCLNKGYDKPLLKVGDIIKYKYFDEIREFEIIEIKKLGGHTMTYQLGINGKRFIDGHKDPYAFRMETGLCKRMLYIYPRICSNKELINILNLYNDGGEVNNENDI